MMFLTTRSIIPTRAAANESSKQVQKTEPNTKNNIAAIIHNHEQARKKETFFEVKIISFFTFNKSKSKKTDVSSPRKLKVYTIIFETNSIVPTDNDIGIVKNNLSEPYAKI